MTSLKKQLGECQALGTGSTRVYENLGEKIASEPGTVPSPKANKVDKGEPTGNSPQK